LPASLLHEDQQSRFADALCAATRHALVEGLAGTNAADVAAAKDTAMNPAVLDAFALAITGGLVPHAYGALVGQSLDLAAARKDVAAIDGAGTELRKVVPNAGSYVSYQPPGPLTRT
jgi:hypothetical protein